MKKIPSILLNKSLNRILFILLPCCLIALAHSEAYATAGTPSDSQNSEQENLSMGAATDFAVLGHETVTNTGDTVLSGKYGVTPGTAVTGENEITGVRGTLEEANAAQADAQVAYTTVKNATASENVFAGAYDVGGMILTPGVYTFSSSVFLTGNLTLDFQGDPDALFLFQIGSTLITAAGPDAASVSVINGGTAQNVYWQVGSSATISTYTVFSGNIIAQTSITMNTGAWLDGRAIALTGAVTMDNNRVDGYAGLVSDITSSDGEQLGFSGSTKIKYHFKSLTLGGDMTIEGPVLMVIDDDFTIGNNQLTVTSNGSLEVYLGGSLNMGGSGSLNNEGVPANAIIYGTHPDTDTSSSITLNGNSSINAVIYTPNADFTSNGGGNNGAILGSIVAQNIILNGNGSVLFDEALKNLEPSFRGYSLSTYNLMRNGAHTPSESAKQVVGSDDYSELFDKLFLDN
jgi:hypothetical protein